LAEGWSEATFRATSNILSTRFARNLLQRIANEGLAHGLAEGFDAEAAAEAAAERAAAAFGGEDIPISEVRQSEERSDWLTF
jgi:hypothetical protein